MTDNEKVIELVQDSPYASNWLKGALTTALECDALDVVRDVKLLAELLEGHLRDVETAGVLS